MHHRDLIAAIDKIGSDHFVPELVAEAKQLAEKELHPFWAIRLRQLEAHREVRDGR